jgi:hypothetical protein
MVILIIVLLFCIWILYKKYYDIEIEEYDLKALYDDMELAPRSIHSRMFKGNIGMIKNNRDYSKYLQYRTIFDSSLHEKYETFIQNILEQYNLPKPDDMVFRINSTPQRILAHFDADNRYLILLEGYKDVLLFRLDEFTVEDQVSFLHEIKDFDMDGIKGELSSRKIPFTQRRLTPGDVLHITPGLYHYVENKELGGYTTAINLDYHHNDPVLDETWEKMWSNARWFK